MKKILAIGAHPDDIEIGCGGTLALLKGRGYSITHLVMTSGEQGGSSEQREVEATKSAALLGASEVIFLRLPDGITTFGLSEKISLIKLMRKIAPDIVFTHSKDDHFPDHQVIRKLTESAITASAGPWYPEAEGKPHKVKKVYGYEVWHPISKYQTAFDITGTMENKRAALSCHYSQTTEIDYLAAVEGLALYRGATSMKGKYAEVFEIIYSEDSL